MGTNVASGAIYPLQFDLLKDFEPIALIATQPFLIVAKKTVPANDLKGLIAWLKANPDKASQGNSGVGTPQPRRRHPFQNAIGARFQMVPYRGAGPSMQDLVAGQIDVMLDQAASSLPQVRSGNIKAYAVTAKNRLAAAPEIPTTDEAGLPGFYFRSGTPCGCPRARRRRLSTSSMRAVVSSLADPGMRQRLVDLRPGNLSARAADAGGARRLPEGRDREVVADHQGGRHQGAINPGTRPRAPGGKCQPGASIRCSKPSTMAWNFSHGASRSL